MNFEKISHHSHHKKKIIAVWESAPNFEFFLLLIWVLKVIAYAISAKIEQYSLKFANYKNFKDFEKIN
jgi:hypothetical protein